MGPLELAQASGRTLAELLARVPFDDRAVEASVDLPRGTLTQLCMAPDRVDPVLARRASLFLAHYAVEIATDLADVVVWSASVESRRPVGDDGTRLYVKCPRCRSDYVLGGVESLALVLTNHLRDDVPVALVYYRAKGKVRCPSATHGGCTAPYEHWQPRAVRLRHPSFLET